VFIASMHDVAYCELYSYCVGTGTDRSSASCKGWVTMGREDSALPEYSTVVSR
jgi:hypothetical protein